MCTCFLVILAVILLAKSRRLFVALPTARTLGSGISFLHYISLTTVPDAHLARFDIEGGTEYWSSNPLNNQDFFEAMVQQASDMGQNIGVYTSDFQWEPIMGDTYTGGSSFPLWYAHYDNNPSFSDFTSFGGWSEPAVKQYDDNGEACGYSYDQNWAETINF